MIKKLQLKEIKFVSGGLDYDTCQRICGHFSGLAYAACMASCIAAIVVKKTTMG
jgi:hypothetical protein